MRTSKGLEAARKYFDNAPWTKTLFPTGNDADVVAQEALEIGAPGFVLNTDPAVDWVAAACDCLPEHERQDRVSASTLLFLTVLTQSRSLL
jgi:hypothetical protein